MRIPQKDRSVAGDTADAPRVRDKRIHGAMQKAGSANGALAGELQLRGAMVPGYRIGVSGKRSGEEAEGAADDFVACGLRAQVCRADPPELELLPSEDDQVHIGQLAVSASELEDMLRTHTTIADAAIFTQPDPILGQRLLAAVVGKYGTIPPDEVRGLLEDHKLASYKIPGRVVAVPRIPRDAEGKVDYGELDALIGA